jgi:tRNA pseudouridine55 synthase
LRHWKTKAGFQSLNYSIAKSLNLLMNGVLIIDKPAGLTSHDVVNRVRRLLNQRSVGHLGTLDPMATGVLPLVIGNFTRLAQFYVSSEKTYEGTIRFGFCTDTYDAEGEPTSEPKEVSLRQEDLEPALARFRGVIEQIPPPFSAKKIKGVPAYKLARKQKEVKLAAVQVEIKELEVLGVDVNRMRFRARVASGTYMRSVAHDLGRVMACGAHLESLRRTAVAEFTVDDAHTLEELAAKAGKPAVEEKEHIGRAVRPRLSTTLAIEPEIAPARTVEERPFKGRVKDGDFSEGFSPLSPEGTPEDNPPVPLARATGIDNLHPPEPSANTLTTGNNSLQPLLELFIHPRKLLPQMPCVTADELSTARIRDGRPVNLPELSRARQVKVFSGQRDLIAIATRVAGTLFHPRIVFV